jgi:hypothetical protein
MHAPKASPEHMNRLAGREQQTRGWAAPLPPVFERTPVVDGIRQRMEWETRDTINNRLWADTISAGPKLVTDKMLAAHPSHGAETMTPAASRTDNRPYVVSGPAYFPSPADPTERPVLPPNSLFVNPWSTGFNVENGDVAKELRGVVKEDNRFLVDNVSNRIVGRTFEHQWIPPADTRTIAERKIDVSELLRPSQDDYRQNYLSSLKTS